MTTCYGDHERGRSVVFEPPHYLHGRHWLSVDAQVQAMVLSFIDESLGQDMPDR